MNTRTANVLRVLAGVVASLVWILAASVVLSLSFMGTLMANDAGEASASAQTKMVLLVSGGQFLAGAAGIPLGLAIFWSTRRKILLRIFAGLLGAGLLMVVVGIYVFASNLPA